MGIFRELIIVHVDEAVDCLLYRLETNQRHLPILGKKFKALDGGIFSKGLNQLLLGGIGRNIGQVQCSRGREYI